MIKTIFEIHLFFISFKINNKNRVAKYFVKKENFIMFKNHRKLNKIQKNFKKIF